MEPEKLADMVVLDVPDYRDLRHTMGTNVIHLTIKSGEVIDEKRPVMA